MPLIDDIRSAGAVAWLRFVKWLNGAAVAILGGIVVVNMTYSDVLRSAIASLPGPVQLVALLGFGILVHVALSKAQKGGE